MDFKREDSAEIAVKKCRKGSVSVKGRLVAADFEVGEPKGSFKGQGATGKKGKKSKSFIKRAKI